MLAELRPYSPLSLAMPVAPSIAEHTRMETRVVMAFRGNWFVFFQLMLLHSIAMLVNSPL
jgi:hypothetical protein